MTEMKSVTVGCLYEYDESRQATVVRERKIVNSIPAIMTIRDIAAGDEVATRGFFVPMCGFAGEICVRDTKAQPVMSISLSADGECYLVRTFHGETQAEALGQDPKVWQAYARLVFTNVPASDVSALLNRQGWFGAAESFIRSTGGSQ
jgi:hypothetical protein